MKLLIHFVLILQNQPFNMYQNKWLFYIKASIFLSSGFTLPFYIARHQLLKD